MQLPDEVERKMKMPSWQNAYHKIDGPFEVVLDARNTRRFSFSDLYTIYSQVKKWVNYSRDVIHLN
jgi:hypothetical protein